ncbi:tudor domain-containing protein 5 [Plakobranchus ocellatus]|uniref:Tudor domain-containing protein 5 n=1 Tax=Plakobranchus ocellatus TaxID=259542 RepID=A0AAV3XUU0_9GAST|nr:tudor domain-containing protein 5 [Plakobranchus ocellatus]
MTEQSKKKEEAKKEIRSLLLSAPLGLTVTELKRDFVEFIGRPLPWKELGYSNPEDFLQDIPDTVKVTYASTGMVLTGVANNSTKHIEKMVQCQKIDSKVKKKVMDRRIRQSRPILGSGGGYPGAGGWAGHRNIRPNFSNTRYPYYNSNQNLPPRMQYHQANQRQRARHMAPPPSVPAYVRGQISQLVSQHPQGLPLTHFCSIFRSRFGVPLDFREMGFSSEQDLLASLRDVIGMRTLAGGETRVMSVQACLAWDHDRWRGDAQTTSTPVSDRKRPLLPLNGPVSEPRPLTSAGKSSQTQRQVPSHGKGRGRGALKREVTTAVGWSAGRLSESEQVSPRDEEEKRRSNSDSLMKMEQNCNIPMSIQNEIKQIMSKRPKGVCASRLPIEYKELFRKILPMKTYGYNSVIEFVSDLPHIIRIERPHPQGDWHLFPVNVADASKPKLEKLEMPSSSATAFSSSTSVCTPSPPPLEVDKALRESVAQVMSISPDGIPLDKFQETYQAVTGKSLNVARYGPGGLKRILHSMSDILIISLDASDKAVVLPKMHSAPRSFDQLQVQFQPIVGSNAEDVSDSILHLPNDAVSPGCTYRPQPLPPSSADGGDYIELYVSNVISPDMFWIQLRGRKTTLALEDLMDELEAVYSNKNLPKEYNMPPVLAQKGMLCAVIYPQDSFWHRGFIMGFKDKLYQVYYVDYGNTCYVSIDQMRLLKSKFLKLPAQAIRARLGHIKPIGGMWQSNSTDRMLTLAREKPLVGLVVAKKDRVLSLCLTDTSKEEDIHFNDVFVDEGYAVFEPDGGALTPQVHEQSVFSLYTLCCLKTLQLFNPLPSLRSAYIHSTVSRHYNCPIPCPASVQLTYTLLSQDITNLQSLAQPVAYTHSAVPRH